MASLKPIDESRLKNLITVIGFVQGNLQRVFLNKLQSVTLDATRTKNTSKNLEITESDVNPNTGK